MIWDVYYTDDAKQDLQEIYNYISDDLLVPETAENQVIRIMEAAESLDVMPLRYKLYEHEPWFSLGIRFFPVDNYLIFYLPDTLQSTVAISRIIHSSRDVEAHLSN